MSATPKDELLALRRNADCAERDALGKDAGQQSKTDKDHRPVDAHPWIVAAGWFPSTRNGSASDKTRALPHSLTAASLNLQRLTIRGEVVSVHPLCCCALRQ